MIKIASFLLLFVACASSHSFSDIKPYKEICISKDCQYYLVYIDTFAFKNYSAKDMIAKHIGAFFILTHKKGLPLIEKNFSKIDDIFYRYYQVGDHIAPFSELYGSICGGLQEILGDYFINFYFASFFQPYDDDKKFVPVRGFYASPFHQLNDMEEDIAEYEKQKKENVPRGPTNSQKHKNKP